MSVLDSVARSGGFCAPVDAPCAAPAVSCEEALVLDARYCPIGWSTRPQPESTTPSGQIATIARSSTTRMGCLGRSPQSLFRQAEQRVASTRRSVVWLAAVSVIWVLGAQRLQAQEAPNPAEAQEVTVQDAATSGVSGLDGQLTLDSGATCLERKRLIARIIRWRESEDVDATLKVQVWGDPKIATRVFFWVARDGVDPAERTLANAPSDCDELHSAVALSIALAIDSLFAGGTATPLTAAIEALEEKQQAKVDSAPKYRPFWEAGLLVGATLSVVPTVAAMAALPRVQYAILPWLAIAAEGVLTRAERLPFRTGPVTYDAMVIGGGLDLCVGGETAERMSFYVCLGGRGGGFMTQGYGTGGNTSTIVTRPWWALVGSAQARAWILPSFGIGIGIEGMFALLDRELSLVTEQGRQTQPLQPFGLAVSGGPVFRFF